MTARRTVEGTKEKASRVSGEAERGRVESPGKEQATARDYTDTGHLRIKDWCAFQGYKKRGPLWVKLHAQLIDDERWIRLPVAARAILPALWVAAGRTGTFGSIPSDPHILATLCHCDQAELLAALPHLLGAGYLDSDESVASIATEVSRCEKRKRFWNREPSEIDQPEGPTSPSLRDRTVAASATTESPRREEEREKRKEEDSQEVLLPLFVPEGEAN